MSGRTTSPLGGRGRASLVNALRHLSSRDAQLTFTCAAHPQPVASLGFTLAYSEQTAGNVRKRGSMRNLNLSEVQGEDTAQSGPYPTLAHPTTKSLYLVLRVNNIELSTATGFLVDTGQGPFLVTNRHVLTGRDQETGALLSPTGALPDTLQIFHHAVTAGDEDSFGRWVARNEALYATDGKPTWYEHPVFGAKADVVVLRLTQLDRVKRVPYELSGYEEFPTGPADRVSVIGFPFGRAASGAFPIWAPGFIASDPVFDYRGLPVMLIDCRGRQGQSGSPVVAYTHSGVVAKEDGTLYGASGLAKFLGMYSGRINSESDIGLVWKPNAILDTLAAALSTINAAGSAMIESEGDQKPA